MWSKATLCLFESFMDLWRNIFISYSWVITGTLTYSDAFFGCSATTVWTRALGSESAESQPPGSFLWLLFQNNNFTEIEVTHHTVHPFKVYSGLQYIPKVVQPSPQSVLEFGVLVQSLSCVSLWPHGPQHARFPCPLSQWCHPTIPSSVVPFSSCL